MSVLIMHYVLSLLCYWCLYYDTERASTRLNRLPKFWKPFHDNLFDADVEAYSIKDVFASLLP